MCVWSQLQHLLRPGWYHSSPTVHRIYQVHLSIVVSSKVHQRFSLFFLTINASTNHEKIFPPLPGAKQKIDKMNIMTMAKANPREGTLILYFPTTIFYHYYNPY